jgi:hypothetical protein
MWLTQLNRRSLVVTSLTMAVVGMIVTAPFLIACRTEQGLGGPGSGNTSIPVWRRAVISIQNTTYSGNPFELEIDATFTHSGTATEITLPGYYAGNDTWKIGFMPALAGDWSYITSSSDADLNGRTGTVTAVASSNHGLLAADATYPRKWRFADGTYLGAPFIIRSLIFWESATTAQFTAMADWMAANGIHMVSVKMLMNGAYPTSGAAIFVSPWANHQFDLTYWDLFEERMDILAARGLGVYIMPYSDESAAPGWAGQSATEELFLRYMVAILNGTSNRFGRMIPTVIRCPVGTVAALAPIFPQAVPMRATATTVPISTT